MDCSAVEVDPQKLTITVRDPALFTVAKIVATYVVNGELSRDADYLLIRCASSRDLKMLETMLGDKE